MNAADDETFEFQVRDSSESGGEPAEETSP